MSVDRLKALTGEREAAIELLSALSAEQWGMPSRCPGWTVKDVVAHMAASAHGLFTPWVLSMMRTKDAERHNDADVVKRQQWAPAKVLHEYVTWTGRAALAHRAMQQPGIKSIPIKLGELGSYPSNLITSAIVFDTYLHMRFDIATALGLSMTPSQPNTLAVTLEWMMAGLGPMNPSSMSWLDQPVDMELVGPGGGIWTVAPSNGGRVEATETKGTGSVRISCPAEKFPLWATHRMPWRECDLTINGDDDVATRFLDSVRII